MNLKTAFEPPRTPSENYESIHKPAATAILRRDKTAAWNTRRDGSGYLFSSNGATSRRTTS
jgi:hypothetical protein